MSNNNENRQRVGRERLKQRIYEEIRYAQGWLAGQRYDVDMRTGGKPTDRDRSFHEQLTANSKVLDSLKGDVESDRFDAEHWYGANGGIGVTRSDLFSDTCPDIHLGALKLGELLQQLIDLDRKEVA